MTTHLCFHGIGVNVKERELGESRYWVTRDNFLRALDIVGQRDVVISFDDGNRSDIEVALPALQERGLHATFFALAGRLGDPDSLSPGDLRALRAAGMDIGTHGWSHVPWRGLSEADTQRELFDARAALVEASAGPINLAALPLGRYDRQLLGRLKTAKYETVFTSDRYRSQRGAWMQARYSATESDTAESFRQIIEHPRGRADVRNQAASMVKRLR